MSKGDLEAVLAEYQRLEARLGAFTSRLRALLADLILREGLNVHSVTSRVKSPASVSRKFQRPDRSYSELSDVTDICGIRITTYFSDEVDRVAHLIAREFVVDPDNSHDKRITLDPDRFGYLSLHQIVKLSPQRTALAEYKDFAPFKAEIQTRSILQHAWAEIEHDLGYKTSQEVPRTIRRRFSRLSGLLELADEEFVGIRDELARYENELPAKIAKEPQSVALDKASLRTLAGSSVIVRDIDRQIGALRKVGIGPVSPGLLSMILRRLQALEIDSVDAVEKALIQYEKQIVKFANEFLSPSSPHTAQIGGGISIFYLCYVLAVISDIPNAIERLVEVSDYKGAKSLISQIQTVGKRVGLP